MNYAGSANEQIGGVGHESLFTHFDFEKNAWKSGWLTITKEYWMKSNSEDHYYPILCMGDPCDIRCLNVLMTID